ARSAIHVVQVSSDVPKPTPVNMFYFGPAQAWGGLVGQVAAYGPKKQIAAAVDSAHIDVSRIVHEEFSHELKESGVFTIAEEDADAQFHLSVGLYGFGIPNGFSSQLKPTLDVVGKLVRRDGTVLWQKRARLTHLSGKTPSHTLDEYLRDPEVIRSSFTSASRF